jgi:hypothetical protein
VILGNESIKNVKLLVLLIQYIAYMQTIAYICLSLKQQIKQIAMTTLKNLATQIENKSKGIAKYESFIILNPLSCIVAEMESSIKRMKSEKEELQKQFDSIELS